MSMTPEQKIKHAILLKAAEWGNIPPLTMEIDEFNVGEIFDANNDNSELQDAANDIRSGDFETNLLCGHSRHYESKAVASKMPDGSWVGWTYWYGGGKHGEPEAMDWMDCAYKVACVEEEKMVVVRTFAKVSDDAA